MRSLALMLGLALFVTSMALVAAALWGPQTAQADTTQVQDTDAMVMNLGDQIVYTKADATFHFKRMSDKVTGRPVYCQNSATLNEPEDGTSLDYQGKAGALLDYILYHGYTGDDTISLPYERDDGTHYITGDADALYLATQIAVYDVLFGSSSTSRQYYSSTNRYRYIADAATKLYEDAVEYAKTGGGPEAGCAVLYQGPTNRQAVVAMIVGGTIRVEKKSTDPNMSTTDSGYSFEGAEFKVYSDAELTNEVATITTNASGVGSSPYLGYNEYWVKETKAPDDYLINDEVFHVTLSNALLRLTVPEKPIFSFVGTVLTKTDAETGKAEPLGGGSLEKAQFLIRYYAGAEDPDALPENWTRAWILQTDKDGTIAFDDAHKSGGSDFYTNRDGIIGIPKGILTITETKAPTGYLIPDNATWTVRIGNEQQGSTITLVQELVSESVMRSDLSFTKQTYDTKRAMPHVLFRMVSETTGESHIIMTDENGEFSSASSKVPHSQNTNALDSFVTDNGTVDESKIDYDADYGLWFYGTSSPHASQQVDDSRGALPYDTYVLYELPSSNTVGYETTSFHVTINSDGTVLEHNPVVDLAITMITKAHDAADQDQYLDGSQPSTIEDAVTVAGVTSGYTYTLETSLIDADSGTKLCDASGAPLSSTMSFTAQSAIEHVTTSLGFDPTAQGSSRVVVCERLYRDGHLMAVHENANDANQTLYVPSLSTKLNGKGDDSHTVEASSTTQLLDHVTYQGLVAGTTYVLKGTLMDKESGLVLVDGAGNQVTATTTFTAEGTSGPADVDFTFDSTTLGGRTVVAYETLWLDDTQLCAHENIDDADQSVEVTRHQVTLPQTGSTSSSVIATTSGCLMAIGAALIHRRPR